QSAQQVAEHLGAGKMVAVLSEGDPLFYGSYMHLHVRLAHRFATEVIPGITAISGCWSATGLPIVQGDDVLTVLPGTMRDFQRTPQASRAVAEASFFYGYKPYLDRLELRDDQTRIASDNREELARSNEALAKAAEGHNVAVVSGGDPGVFAMAAAVCEAIEAG